MNKRIYLIQDMTTGWVLHAFESEKEAEDYLASFLSDYVTAKHNYEIRTCVLG